MQNSEILLVDKFKRLSGEGQAEIFGMVKALVFAQSREDQIITMERTPVSEGESKKHPDDRSADLIRS
jgi:hypothetical protein